MKNNIFGYIFILFIIIIMGFAIYRVRIQRNNASEENGKTVTLSTEEVEKGTEMTLAISNFDTINPIITKNKKVQDIDKIIYEPLISITEDYKLEYILARECAKSSDTAYIVKIRQGVKWSDGSKFTSDDVKYTIDRLKDENSNSIYSENVRHIKEIDIIDNYTLKIELFESVKNFEYYLNFPILSNSYYQNEDFWNTEKNKAPIATGEFKISEVNYNNIVLERNENWWNKDKTSIINKITINFYSTVAELYNAFKMGGIDIISTENSAYQNYIGTIGYDITEIEGREYIFLALNTKNGILSDPNVRKAVRASIDKNRVISNSYGGLYKIADFPLNTGNYLVDLKEDNFYSTEEKDKFLKASGWEYRNRCLAKNNKL